MEDNIQKSAKTEEVPQQKTSVTQKTSPTEFSSFTTLLKRTWDVFTKTFLNLFVFNIVIQGVIIALTFFVLLLVGINLLSNFLQGVPQKNLIAAVFTSGSPGFMLIFIVCIAYIVVIVLSLILQIANILIIAGYKEKFSFGNIFNKSLNLVLPFFITSLLFGLIVLGGTFVFVIPGIIFSFIFMFYLYEIILNNKKGMGSLKGSLAIVSDNFWAIFLRLLLLLLLFLALLIPYFIIVFVFAAIGSSLGSNIGGVKNVLTVIPTLFGWIIGWYVSIFVFVLYDEAKSRTNFEKPVSMKWVWTISIIGWVIGVILLVAGILVPNFIKSAQNTFKKEKGSTKMDSKYSYTSQLDSLIQSGRLKLSTANQLAGKKNLSKEEKDEIEGLVAGALTDFKSATEKYPENYLAWYYLGEAYKSLIGYGQNAEVFAIESYQKAIELNPNDYSLYLALGGIYYQDKNYDKAIESFQNVVRLKPDYANGYFNLGVAYKKVGAKNSARKALERALELLPKDDPSRYKAEVEFQGL